MLIIIIFFIIMIIIFFQTGKSSGENGFKWAIIGFIGFTLSFAIAIMLIGETFIAAGVAACCCLLIRAQLLHTAHREKIND